jgi:hypothetical protein
MADILMPMLLLGSATAAYAQVTSVQVTPSPATVGQPATVTVTGGAAPCGAVEINYGDGPPTTYPITALPLAQAYTWTAAGTYTVIATGQGNCAGQASVNITVARRNKAGVSPHTGRLRAMRITSYFGLSAPGGAAAIAGQDFGPNRGSVVAKLKAWNGAARIVALTVTRWSPTLIEVEWPASLIGVRDQSDAIVEVKHDNATDRASWKVFFRADTEHKVLPMSGVTVVACSKDGNKNWCNDVNPGRNGGCAIDPFTTACTGSFGAAHYNCHGAVGTDNGTDRYRIVLANDWRITDVSFHNDPGEGGLVTAPSPPLVSGSATWSPRVTWSVSPSNTVAYCARVHITGPKGVPH